MRLYLLVRQQDGKSAEGLVVSGTKWQLQVSILERGATENPEFLCISYTWGFGRVPSPCHPGFEVSDRTIPALESAVQLRPEAKMIWIDALCVPQDPRERYQTLESMGFIYACASEVLAVLSSTAHPALHYIKDHQSLDRDHLLLLEKEEWVTRAWTYQEAVNCRDLTITCDGAGSLAVGVLPFLNCVGQALSKIGIPQLERRQHYPRLDAFEDLMDFFTAAYEQRSALQVMAKMDRRTQQRPEDHFFAMIGAVTNEPASSSGTDDACESFMSLCERKGDFSFIYSSAPRNSVPTRRWRPVVGNLPAILAWDVVGSGQPGSMTDQGLRLSQVFRLEQGVLSEKAVAFALVWLERIGHLTRDRSVYSALQLMGFEGDSKCWTTRDGYFFPYTRKGSAEYFIISASLRWTFGAPGFAVTSSGDGACYSPGVFLGDVEGHEIIEELLDGQLH